MKKKNIIISIILTIISIAYTFLVKKVNVRAIGPNGSKVGLAKINGPFSKLVGSHMTIYKVTEILGYVVILIVLVYGIIGLIHQYL